MLDCKKLFLILIERSSLYFHRKYLDRLGIEIENLKETFLSPTLSVHFKPILFKA